MGIDYYRVEVVRMGLFGKKNKYPKEFKDIYIAVGLGVDVGRPSTII